MLTLKQSNRLFKSAAQSLVGGVDSPVRSFKSVNSDVLFAQKASGPYLWDVDGNKYVDYIMSWGAAILGHAYKPVVDEAISAVKNGSSFGLATEQEIKLANIIKRHYPSVDKVRFTASGTEACMTAVRLARAFTGKTKIIKFDGCYHGHFDSLLIKSGSGNLTFGIPSGEGILPAYSRDTLSIPFNEINILKQAVALNKKDLACIIVEPVPCNTGVILPQHGFLKALAKVAKENKIVLIFDEVVTGFRLSLKGGQGLFGITPDLTCFGKIIGGGFPIGAVGGRKDIMDLLAPVGGVYQAGTFSGNPVSISAGIKTLECLEQNKKLYQTLDKKTEHLVSVIRKEAKTNGINLAVNTVGSVFSIFFTDENMYASFFAQLCQEGILFPPSAFEACFVSQTHNEAVIEQTAKAVKKIFRMRRAL
ncbi:MAG: glutamate-1-semialdehyde 2,1-aminomutase [Candidatus Omnitrophica bacterium]|nr:glutamate-1-semialdehyde 2,1-aminomutase [Candidatus Omnitrophota bacterium]